MALAELASRERHLGAKQTSPKRGCSSRHRPSTTISGRGGWQEIRDWPAGAIAPLPLAAQCWPTLVAHAVNRTR